MLGKSKIQLKKQPIDFSVLTDYLSQSVSRRTAYRYHYTEKLTTNVVDVSLICNKKTTWGRQHRRQEISLKTFVNKIPYKLQQPHFLHSLLVCKEG